MKIYQSFFSSRQIARNIAYGIRIIDYIDKSCELYRIARKHKKKGEKGKSC